MWLSPDWQPWPLLSGDPEAWEPNRGGPVATDAALTLLSLAGAVGGHGRAATSPWHCAVSNNSQTTDLISA